MRTTTAMRKDLSKEKGRVQSKKQKKTWKLGTWNVRGLTSKERELEEEFEKINLDILAITETKKKGSGIEQMEREHILIYSGVDQNRRSAAGVGCIINKQMERDIVEWKAYSERILAVRMKPENRAQRTIIIVYAPNQDEKATEKEQFWQKLTQATEESRGKLYKLGDFDSRVGKKDSMYNTIIGKHGENTRNGNGKIMLDFCILQNMAITNSYFEHKKIHQYTREMKSREQRSIIDYVLVERSNMKEIMDTRVRRSAEIGSDHYLVTTTVREEENDNKSKEVKMGNEQIETIRAYELQNEHISKIYSELLNKRFEKSTVKYRKLTTEQLWKHFKDSLIDCARKVCGTNRRKANQKQTAWWSKEVKMGIKEKKEKWKIHLRKRDKENYEIYKTSRKKPKQLIQEAKRNSWVQFGVKMEENS